MKLVSKNGPCGSYNATLEFNQNNGKLVPGSKTAEVGIGEFAINNKLSEFPVLYSEQLSICAGWSNRMYLTELRYGRPIPLFSYDFEGGPDATQPPQFSAKMKNISVGQFDMECKVGKMVNIDHYVRNGDEFKLVGASRCDY